MVEKFTQIRVNKKTIRNIGGGVALFLADELRDLELGVDDEVIVTVESNNTRRIVIEAAKKSWAGRPSSCERDLPTVARPP
jgi:hypothetical protein